MVVDGYELRVVKAVSLGFLLISRSGYALQPACRQAGRSFVRALKKDFHFYPAAQCHLVKDCQTEPVEVGAIINRYNPGSTSSP